MRRRTDQSNCVFCGKKIPQQGYLKPEISKEREDTTDWKSQMDVSSKITMKDVCGECLSYHFGGDLRKHLKTPMIQKIGLVVLVPFFYGIMVRLAHLTDIDYAWELPVKLTVVILIGLYSVYYLIKSGIFIARIVKGRRLYTAFKGTTQFSCPVCKKQLQRLIIESEGKEYDSSKVEYLGLEPIGHGNRDHWHCPYCKHEFLGKEGVRNSSRGILRILLQLDDGIYLIMCMMITMGTFTGI